MNEDQMLTTFDNRFDPFNDFVAWWKEDLRLGHDCCGLLASRACTSETFSDQVNAELIDDAMQEIVEDFPMIYRIVKPNDYKKEKALPVGG